MSTFCSIIHFIVFHFIGGEGGYKGKKYRFHFFLCLFFLMSSLNISLIPIKLNIWKISSYIFMNAFRENKNEINLTSPMTNSNMHYCWDGKYNYLLEDLWKLIVGIGSVLIHVGLYFETGTRDRMFSMKYCLTMFGCLGSIFVTQSLHTVVHRAQCLQMSPYSGGTMPSNAPHLTILDTIQ